MSQKMKWGIATLIVFLLGVSAFLLLRNIDTKPPITVYKDVEPSKDNPPPAEPGYKWVWHHNHWDRVKEDTPSEQGNATPLNTAEYGITRQGKRYKKNPAHADIPAANATPTGPPLTIDWQDGGHPPPGSVIDWQDPRTWESFRNFWGFEPPVFNRGYEYVPTLDNWGTPLQHFRGTFIVTHYKKRIGFRPSPEELAEYKQLQAQLETARASGDTLLSDILRQDIQALMNSARGELPIKHTFTSIGYGPAGFADDPEQEKAADEASIRDVYKRMGIEHLYEFYEK